MATVAINAVQKDFDAAPVTHDATIDTCDGEFVTLAGSSGCGEPTALHVMAGPEGITGGAIQVGRHNVNGVSPKGRGIVMVFRSDALQRRTFRASICSENVTAAAFPRH